MAALIHPTEGRIYVRGKWSPGGNNLWVILFKNNVTITAATVFSGLTEADFSGYSRLHSTWSSPADDGSGNAESHPPTQTFSHNGGGTSNTIYGYAICPDNAGIVSTILCAFNFTSPISMAVLGDVINFNPVVKQGQF